MDFGSSCCLVLLIDSVNSTGGSGQDNKPLTNNQDGTNDCSLLLFPLFCLLFSFCFVLIGLTLMLALNRLQYAGSGLFASASCCCRCCCCCCCCFYLSHAYSIYSRLSKLLL
ncbi:unnamed protein product [Polarella glacialis]|uniref:Uncharacterized protein n=1 Tax=Polarella glacialis TaxID=89957 RepID=A0A813KY32_POLGL|nr:unnamed protein product [Polarella glacialis]